MRLADLDIKIDRNKWRKVKLGDVASEYSKRISNPSESDFDRFVGNSNIGQWDFRIKSWEDTDSVTSAMKLFEPKDYLLVRRSLYASDFRERAPRADFPGVCSGDILTIRENPEEIADGFLVGVLNSPALWKFVVANASGSITRRIKWRDLANYEFLLPPKAQQAEIAELLWAMDDVIHKDTDLLVKSRNQFMAYKNDLVLRGVENEHVFSKNIKQKCAAHWNDTTVGELLENKIIERIQDGNHGEIHPKSADYEEEGIPFIMANCLQDGEILFHKVKKIPQEKTDRLRIGFSKPGDVLLSHKGTVGEVALVPDDIEWPYLMLTPQVTFYRISRDRLIGRFLYYVFTSSYFQHQLERLSSQSTRAYVGITAQRNLKVVIPESIEEQQKIVDILSVVERSVFRIKEKIAVSKTLQKSLICQIF